MSSTTSDKQAPDRRLSLLDSTCIIVGIIIGSGIYKTTPVIAANVADSMSLIMVWLAGGAIALVGAMCYAELSTAFPRSGGDYVFLTQAYGRRVGFTFAWVEFWIIRPGNVGMMAFVLSPYADQLVGLSRLGTEFTTKYSSIVYAGTSVALLTVVNILGVQFGKTVQNVLTIGKVLALLCVSAVGLTLIGAPSQASNSAAPAVSSNIQLAMILALFTYGGWNEMTYVAAEVRNPQTNILRALITGTLAVVAVYVVANIAFVSALGMDGVRGSSALAADVISKRFGADGAKVMSVCVCLSCLGAINGMLFTGSRIYYALGTEHPLFGWIGKWNGRLGSPVRSLLLQCTVTISLIVTFGSYDQGFDRLLNFTAPVYWFFISLVAIGLFILRKLRPADAVGYRVIGYPITPAMFFLVCAFMFYSSITYALSNASREAWWAISILAAGAIVARATCRAHQKVEFAVT